MPFLALAALALTGCITPGGGGVNMTFPDSIAAGEAIPIRVEVSVFDVPRIEGRFRDLALHYRLVGESTFRTSAAARRIDVDKASEAYEFSIPPYPPNTCGSIELYLTMQFDGRASRTDGHKKIRVDRMLADAGSGPNAVVVSPSCLSSWTLVPVRTARVRLVDTLAEEGHADSSNSLSRAYARGLRLELNVGELEAAQARTTRFNGVAMADITTLRYRSYVQSQGGGIGAPFLVLGVDRNGDGHLDDELRFFPRPRVHVWQTWNALDGGWWARSTGRPPIPGDTVSWRAYLATSPNARLASAITIGAWKLGGPQPFDATVDRFEIGIRGSTTTFVFAPTAVSKR
jgi:hypothetical protein